MDDEDELDWLGVDFSGNQPTIKSNAGHNQKHELDEYAEEARRGLQMVGEGEEHVIAGWLAYGSALNKGRKRFGEDDDYNFGKWKQENVYSNLEESFAIHPADEAAAMWAAKEPDLLCSILEENPKIRSVRGAHAKWKKDNKTPRGGASTDPNLRLPTEEEAKRIRNMKDRMASTDSEPEKEAVQKKLEKLKESGIDVDSVVSQEEEDSEREVYRDKQRPLDYMANEIARILIDTKDYSFVAAIARAAYPKDGELEQAYEIITEGQ